MFEFSDLAKFQKNICYYFCCQNLEEEKWDIFVAEIFNNIYNVEKYIILVVILLVSLVFGYDARPASS